MKLRALPPLPQSGWCCAGFMLLLGACGALALPPLFLFPVLPFVLGLFYKMALRAPTLKHAAWRGFLFGMGFHIAGLYWLTNAILTRVDDFWWVVPFATPAVALLIAPLMAIPAVLCRFVPVGWASIAVFSGSWTLADMARVFYFSGFPWNPLGSALELPGHWGDWLIQPASILGVDGLTLVLVLASLAVWQGRWARCVVLGCAVLWCAWGAWRAQSYSPLAGHKMPTIVIVQGNVTESDVLGRRSALEQFEAYLQLTAQGVQQAKETAKGQPLAVVWPESAFPGLLDEDELARRDISLAAGGVPVLVGTDRRAGQGRWYNSLIALGAEGQIEAVYDKSRLVPFGEYQPWIIPFQLLPAEVVPGPGLQTWDLPQIGRVGPMVCYEVIFSGSVVAPGKRPDWLLTISNDAWYGNSAGPRQHLATGRLRAVEEGLPVVFVNNRGVSAVYDAHGHEVRRTSWGQEQVVVVSLPPPEQQTIFGKVGRLVPFFLSLILIVFGFFYVYGKRK